VSGYAGLGSPALSWELVREKFGELSAGHTTPNLRDAIADAVHDLEHLRVSDLTALLAKVGADHESEPAHAAPSAAPL
jgi:2-methylcitrate dehydratase